MVRFLSQLTIRDHFAVYTRLLPSRYPRTGFAQRTDALPPWCYTTCGVFLQTGATGTPGSRRGTGTPGTMGMKHALTDTLVQQMRQRFAVRTLVHSFSVGFPW
eukprot:9479132-Pyramimonas_sp.AAC.3